MLKNIKGNNSSNNNPSFINKDGHNMSNEIHKAIEEANEIEGEVTMNLPTGDILIQNTISFNNKSDLLFSDISSEEYRTYDFSNGKTITISQPLKIHVSKSGGHRIYDSFGISHYIPSGWIHLSWRAKTGQPNFVK